MGLSASEVWVPGFKKHFADVHGATQREKPQSQAHSWFSFTVTRMPVQQLVTASPRPHRKVISFGKNNHGDCRLKQFPRAQVISLCTHLHGMYFTHTKWLSEKMLSQTFWGGPHCLVHPSLLYYSLGCNKKIMSVDFIFSTINSLSPEKFYLRNSNAELITKSWLQRLWTMLWVIIIWLV